MSEVLSRGGVALLKREKASLVAATGLIFERLKETSQDISLQDSLISYKGGTWGDESVEGVGYPVLRSSNMRGKRVDVLGAAWCKIPDKQAEAFSLESGDILITKSSGSFDLVGKAALFDNPNDGNLYLFSNFTMRLRPDRKKLIPEYLAWFLRSPQALSWRFENQQTTVGLRNLQTKEYLSQVIPIPPLEIQKQVVEYLNAVETESKESITVKLPDVLDKQRHVVQRVEILAASIAKAKSLREDARVEAEYLIKSARSKIVGELRITYPVKPLSELCTKITDGPHVSPSYVPKSEGIAFISARNISETGYDFSTAQYVSRSDYEEFSKRVNIERGDVLLIKVGATTGTARRVDIDVEFNIWVNVALLKPYRDVIDNAFLEHMLNTPSIKEHTLSMTFGSATPYIGLGKIGKIEIPVPPLDEQRRIVGYLDSVQARLASLRELQSQTQEELDALLPSVLDKAFKGEL